jgi:hypothetical protein
MPGSTNPYFFSGMPNNTRAPEQAELAVIIFRRLRLHTEKLRNQALTYMEVNFRGRKSNCLRSSGTGGAKRSKRVRMQMSRSKIVHKGKKIVISGRSTRSFCRKWAGAPRGEWMDAGADTAGIDWEIGVTTVSAVGMRNDQRRANATDSSPIVRTVGRTIKMSSLLSGKIRPFYHKFGQIPNQFHSYRYINEYYSCYLVKSHILLFPAISREFSYQVSFISPEIPAVDLYASMITITILSYLELF